MKNVTKYQILLQVHAVLLSHTSMPIDIVNKEVWGYNCHDTLSRFGLNKMPQKHVPHAPAVIRCTTCVEIVKCYCAMSYFVQVPGKNIDSKSYLVVATK